MAPGPQTVFVTTMRPDGENQAIQDVESWLAGKFPEVPTEVVASAVTEAFASLNGPIRAFVPLLVEHAARDQITRFARGKVPTPT